MFTCCFSHVVLITFPDVYFVVKYNFDMLTVNVIRYVNSVFQPKLTNVIGLCSSQCGVSVNQAPFSKIHVSKNCTDKKYSFEKNFT